MRVLLTAFEHYEDWRENSSWLTLIELLKDRPSDVELVTRRYPVDLAQLRTNLFSDLDSGFDAILHLGQSPGANSVKLESIALNVAGCISESGDELAKIVEAGPLAFQSGMPLGRWARLLREQGVPALVSYHAGTFLCNATLYLAHHWHFSRKRQCRIGFVHLPLTTSQVVAQALAFPSLPVDVMAKGVRLIIEDLSRSPLPAPTPLV